MLVVVVVNGSLIMNDTAFAVVVPFEKLTVRWLNGLDDG